MDDYFAEADEHLVAVRRCLLHARGRAAVELAVGGPRRTVPELPFAQGHLGDGRAARSRTARASHGELPARDSAGRRRARLPANLETLVDGARRLEAVIVARRAGSRAAVGRRRRSTRSVRWQRRRAAPTLRSTAPASLGSRVRGVDGPVRAVARARRARRQGGHDSRAAAADRDDSSRSRRACCRRRHLVRVRRPTPTTRRSLAAWRDDGVTYEPSSADAAPAAESPRRRRRSLSGLARGRSRRRAGELRARRSGPSGRSDAAGRRSGGHALAPRGHAAARRALSAVAASGGCCRSTTRDRAAAARPARRRHARAAGPGRRDLPPDAVRRPRPGARQRQARARSSSPVRGRRSTSSSSNG